MQNPIEKQILELIKRNQKILILPSSPPDGDSLGSAIALYLVLKKLNKEVTVVCTDPIPEVLQFLPNIKVIGDKVVSSNDFIITIDSKNATIDNIQSSIEGNKINIVITPKEGSLSEDNVHFNKAKTDFDLIITVDTAELSQLKSFYENNVELFHQIPVINIDHHISNTHFGKINHVDIMSSSTTELIFPVIEQLAEQEKIELIDEDVATLLLTGIITDTGSFQNANTTPRSFAKAAQLISYGARQQEIIQHIYKTKQLSQLKLWGRVLSKIQTDEKHRIVWSVVSQQDFKDTESSLDQTGDVIDELMTNAPGAEIVILMKEKEGDLVSISIRTTSPSVDASRIAEHFGGGGHTQAAGCTVQGADLREVEYKVIGYVKDFQNKRLGIVEEEVEDVSSEAEPMIDVKELMQRIEKAQKATDLMPTPKKVKKKEEKDEKKEEFKPTIPEIDEEPPLGSGYRFED